MQLYGRLLRYLPSILVLAIGLVLSYSAYNFVDKSLRDQQQTEFETLSANFIIKIQDEINHETSLLNNLATSLSLAPELMGKENLDRLSSNLIHNKSTLNNLVIVEHDTLNGDYRFIYNYPENTQRQLEKHMPDIVKHALQQKLGATSTVHPEDNRLGILVVRQIPTNEMNNRHRFLIAHLNPKQAFGNTLHNLLPDWLNLQLYLTHQREHTLLYQHFVDESSLTKINGEATDLLTNRPEHSLFLPGSIDLYGQTVSVLLTPEKSYFSNTSPIAGYVLALGVLLSLALAVYINTLRRRNSFIQQQVDERTATLEELNQALTDSISSHQADKEKLAVTAQEMRSLVNSVDGVLWEADLKSHKITFISPQVKRILGYEPEEVLAFSAGFLELINPKDKQIYFDVLENLEADSHPQREFRMSNAAGETVYIRDILSPVVVDNEIPRIRGVMLDVSKYKIMHQEQSKMEARLRQAQKLESVGQLAAGIAHEINTPAQFVSDNIQFLQDAFADLKDLQQLNGELSELAPDSSDYQSKSNEIKQLESSIDLEFLLEDIPEALTQSHDGITRISSIVKAMKEFSHPGSDGMEVIDINNAIENTITVARNEWRYVAEVEKDFDPDLPLVECLPGEFNQVILNMVVNAAQAIAETDLNNDRGQICVKTQKNGENVSIHISDNGAGISEDKIERVFDPFFTTKEVGKGTGQGLAIAYSVIVDKHNGAIDVESTLGQGTTFIIKIPFKQLPTNDTIEPHKIALA